jgi:prepilin-type processing-associated H-X9-DG protein
MTYTTTGVMCDMVGPYLTTKTGRKLSLVRAPSRAPLIFLARQRPGNDGYSRSVVHETGHVEVARDLAARRPEDTVLFNFDLGLMPVLMADGHVEAIAFQQLNSFVQQDTWQSKP